MKSTYDNTQTIHDQYWFLMCQDCQKSELFIAYLHPCLILKILLSSQQNLTIMTL